jgi:polyisoprenoid-binding protein YceI
MKTKSLVRLATLAALFVPAALPAAEFKIDPAHTSLVFSIRHLGISNVHGRFDKFSGTVTVEDGKVTAIQGTAQVASVNTGVQKRDQHLLTPDFFDAAKFPTISFKSKSIDTKDGKTTFTADFTMHGVTKEVTAPIEISAPVVDPQGVTRVGLHASAKLDRKDYGIDYGKVLDSGAALVGEEVSLEINAEAIEP